MQVYHSSNIDLVEFFFFDLFFISLRLIKTRQRTLNFKTNFDQRHFTMQLYALFVCLYSMSKVYGSLQMHLLLSIAFMTKVLYIFFCCSRVSPIFFLFFFQIKDIFRSTIQNLFSDSNSFFFSFYFSIFSNKFEK